MPYQIVFTPPAGLENRDGSPVPTITNSLPDFLDSSKVDEWAADTAQNLADAYRSEAPFSFAVTPPVAE